MGINLVDLTMRRVWRYDTKGVIWSSKSKKDRNTMAKTNERKNKKGKNGS